MNLSRKLTEKVQRNRDITNNEKKNKMAWFKQQGMVEILKCAWYITIIKSLIGPGYCVFLISLSLSSNSTVGSGILILGQLLSDLAHRNTRRNKQRRCVRQQCTRHGLEGSLDKGLSALDRGDFRVSNEELVGDARVAVVDVEVCGEACLSGKVWDCLLREGMVGRGWREILVFYGGY